MAESSYFCGVKTQERYNAAANKQRFLCHKIVNSKRIDWGNSNVPKASALECLTSRNALLFIVKIQEL